MALSEIEKTRRLVTIPTVPDLEKGLSAPNPPHTNTKDDSTGYMQYQKTIGTLRKKNIIAIFEVVDVDEFQGLLGFSALTPNPRRLGY